MSRSTRLTMRTRTMPNDGRAGRIVRSGPPAPISQARPHPGDDPPQLSLVALQSDAITTISVRSNGHHPFIFRKMVIGQTLGPRPRDGEIVRVVDRDHVFLGFGLWNAESEI